MLSSLIAKAKITKMNGHTHLGNSLEAVAVEGFLPDPPSVSLLLMWANGWPTKTRIWKGGSGEEAKQRLELTSN